MSKLFHSMALSYEECIEAIAADGKPTFPQVTEGQLWCNATWDTVLCWPATLAGTASKLQCPPLRGLNSENAVLKHCHVSGRWTGRDENDFSTSYGFTDYTPCIGSTVSTFLDITAEVQDIARKSRFVDITGLALSLLALFIAIVILTKTKGLRNFKYLIREQLMFAMLLLVLVRLILSIDLTIPSKVGSKHIYETKIVCEIFYIILEYFKLVPFGMVLLESLYLICKAYNTGNTVTSRIKLGIPLLLAWGIPVIITSVWLVLLMATKQGDSVQSCLGAYYILSEYWLIMTGFQIVEILTCFSCLLTALIIERVNRTSETGGRMTFVKSALLTFSVLMVLVAPVILQIVPFLPNKSNMKIFAGYTYLASVISSFQGFLISLLYCFCNCKIMKELIRPRHTNYNLQPEPPLYQPEMDPLLQQKK